MLKQIIKQKTDDKTKKNFPACAAAAFCAGFVCSCAQIFGSPCSLGVCAAACSGSFSPFAIFGMLLYIILSRSFSFGLTKICAALLIGALFPLFKKLRFYDPSVLSIASCLIMLVINCAAAGGGAVSYGLAFAMVDSLICACVIFMFMTLADDFSVTGTLRISGISGVFASLLYIMAVCTLSSIPLPLDLGRIFGTVILMYFAKKYRATGGAFIGVLTACGVILASPSLAGNTLIMASSGLICGALAPLGVVVTVVSFMVSSLLSLTAVGVNSDTFVMFWDLAIGVMISILLPDELFSVSRSLLTTSKSTVDLIGQTASSRLSFASKTIHDVRKEIDLISLKIENRQQPVTMRERVCTSLCTSCEMSELCLKKNSSKTAKGLSVLEDIQKNYGTLSIDDLHTYLPTCTKQAVMQTAFETVSDELNFERACKRTLNNMRQLLSEQLRTMEELLSDMSARVGRIKEVDEHLSAKATELFETNGCRGARVCVYKNESKRRFCEAFINGSFKSDIVRLTMRLSSLMECDMELPAVNVIGKVTRLVFTEKPELEASIASFQASCNGGKYCGDTVDTLTLNESERYVLLSDGMGTGERARLDSMFTVSLVRRLITSGISMGCSERLINSALCVKGWDESFSTVDILRLDLFSHTASFLKAGAASSYILREGSIIKIESAALPAGILGTCEPKAVTEHLCANDVIIVTSDGVDESIILDDKTLPDAALKFSSDKLSKYIGSMAVKSYGGNVSDDITVAVVKIDRSN